MRVVCEESGPEQSGPLLFFLVIKEHFMHITGVNPDSKIRRRFRRWKYSVRFSLQHVKLGEVTVMPKITFDTLDAVPEAFRTSAKSEDGKLVIDVVETAKLNEFRDNNIKLSTERDQLNTTLESLRKIVGDDPDAFESSLAELRRVDQEVKDGKLKGSDAIAKEVDSRIGSLKADYDKQLKAANAEAAAWKDKASDAETKFKRTIVASAVTAAVLDEKSGALPNALPDILERAYRIYHVDEGDKLVARDGEATIYGSDGATPMQPGEWLEKLKESAPYFFKGSVGGGATGGSKVPGGLSSEDFNKLSGADRLALARRSGR